MDRAHPDYLFSSCASVKEKSDPFSVWFDSKLLLRVEVTGTAEYLPRLLQGQQGECVRPWLSSQG